MTRLIREAGEVRPNSMPRISAAPRPARAMGHNRAAWAALIGAALVLWLLVTPPRWWLNLTKPVNLADPPAAGALVVQRYDCRSCHRIDERGALTAPDLARVTERLDRVSLRLWLIDPRAIDGRTAMPNLRLSDPEIDAIIAYLTALDRRP